MAKSMDQNGSLDSLNENRIHSTYEVLCTSIKVTFFAVVTQLISKKFADRLVWLMEEKIIFRFIINSIASLVGLEFRLIEATIKRPVTFLDMQIYTVFTILFQVVSICFGILLGTSIDFPLLIVATVFLIIIEIVLPGMKCMPEKYHHPKPSVSNIYLIMSVLLLNFVAYKTVLGFFKGCLFLVFNCYSGIASSVELMKGAYE